MKREIAVFLGEDPVRIGTLSYAQDGNRESCAFAYDDAWLASTDAFELSPSLPLRAGWRHHSKGKGGSVFFDCIADTEPNGWGKKVILRDGARQRQDGNADRQPLNSLDFLLSVDDFSRLGALRFRDEQGEFVRISTPSGSPPMIELKHLVASSRAVEMGKETERDLAFLRGRGTSLEGMRPKASIVDDSGNLYLAKFPSAEDTRNVVAGEIMALQLASDAKIRVPDFRLVDSGGVPVALIRRFDREAGKRVMYVSAATLLQADSEGEHTYTEIVDTLRQRSAFAKDDMAELWRRMAFNILIKNVDDHLHNHGFLHYGHGRWALAPAFDLNPFPDKAHVLKTWISEETGESGSIRDAYETARHFGLDKTQAAAILGEVVKAASGWQRVAASLGMKRNEIQEFEPAFEHAQMKEAIRIVEGALLCAPKASAKTDAPATAEFLQESSGLRSDKQLALLASTKPPEHK